MSESLRVASRRSAWLSLPRNLSSRSVAAWSPRRASAASDSAWPFCRRDERIRRQSRRAARERGTPSAHDAAQRGLRPCKVALAMASRFGDAPRQHDGRQPRDAALNACAAVAQDPAQRGGGARQVALALPPCFADPPRQHHRRQPHRIEARPLALGRDRQCTAEPARRLVEAAARQRQQLVGRGQRPGGGAQRLALAVDAARRAGPQPRMQAGERRLPARP